MRQAVMLVAVVLSGCAGMFPTVVPEAQSAEYNPTGEVQANRYGATFDAVRVRNPNCNLSKRTDGSWGGKIGDHALDVSVTPDRIRGVNFVLSKTDSTADRLIITGQMDGKIYRFELGPTDALVRTPNQSLTFPGRVVEGGVTYYGPMKELSLKGEASGGMANVAWPQLALALLAAFQ